MPRVGNRPVAGALSRPMIDKIIQGKVMSLTDAVIIDLVGLDGTIYC